MSMSTPSATKTDDESGSVTARAADAAGMAVSTAKDESRALFDEVRDRARKEGSSQTDRIASGLHTFAHQLTDMADQSPDQGQGAARLAQEAGERLDRVAGRIEDRGVDGLTQDARQLASSRPLMYIGLAAGAGFVVGRFLRNADIGSLVQASQQHDSDEAEPSSGDIGQWTASEGGQR
jgi:hypothetical protein